jgi:hypothetical protein
MAHSATMFGYGGGVRTQSGTFRDTASFDDELGGDFSEEAPTGQTAPEELRQERLIAPGDANALFKVATRQGMAPPAQDKSIVAKPEPQKQPMQPLPSKGKRPGRPMTKWEIIALVMFWVLLLVGLLWHFFG